MGRGRKGRKREDVARCPAALGGSGVSRCTPGQDCAGVLEEKEWLVGSRAGQRLHGLTWPLQSPVTCPRRPGGDLGLGLGLAGAQGLGVGQDEWEVAQLPQLPSPLSTHLESQLLTQGRSPAQEGTQLPLHTAAH